MGKKSTPKPPDLTPLSDAQLEISREQLAQAREQMGISKQQFDKFMKLSDAEMAQSQKQYEQQLALQSRALDQADKAAGVSKSVADAQIKAMQQNMGFAAEDRKRYKDVALPLQDAFIKEANAYDSPQRQAQAAAQALADNQQQIEAQRANTASQLASMGVDPSQVMSTSLANQIGVAGAAMGAHNANDARQQVQDTGRGMRMAAINMLNGLPAQAQAGYATAANAGNSAAGNTNAATGGFATASGMGATAAGIRQNSLNTAASITGSPMAWASLGNQSYGGASNGIMNASTIQNQMFQNQMSVQQMKNDQSNATMSAIGSAAGMAAMFMAEGGSVDDQYDYRIPRNKDGSMSGKGRVQAGLAMAGSALQTMGSDHEPNPYLHEMEPIYRAEGGEVGYYAEGGMPRFSTGGGMAPMPRRAAPMAPPTGGYMPPRGSVGGGMAPAPRPIQMPMRAAPMAPPTGGFLTPRAFGGVQAMRMMAEGGGMEHHVVPNLQTRDKVPAMLGPGEYVVPADVVRVKGQEFFDKLVAKHHRPGS